ncbi:MAG: hypothetical protein AABX82_06020 [Nanoarchaeota archaeon]
MNLRHRKKGIRIPIEGKLNNGWHLIPEDQQSQVQSVVGSQLDMGDVYGHSSGDVDSFRDLVVYMVEVDSRVTDTYGWNSSIRTGVSDLEIDTIDWEYNGLQYNEGLQLAIGYWDSYLAPSVVQVASGGDIWFTRTSNWQTDTNMTESSSGIWTIDDVEVDYTAVGSTGDDYDVGALFAHEIGHSFFNHTNVDVFIMDQSPTVDEPHELELLVAGTLNNVGYESPRGEPINLFNGYTE